MKSYVSSNSGEYPKNELSKSGIFVLVLQAIASKLQSVVTLSFRLYDLE